MLGEPEVVGVAEGDQLARRGLDAPVAGGCDAGVLLTDDLDRAGERADDVGCSVRRAVVDDDELEVAVGLPENRRSRRRRSTTPRCRRASRRRRAGSSGQQPLVDLEVRRHHSLLGIRRHELGSRVDEPRRERRRRRARAAAPRRAPRRRRPERAGCRGRPSAARGCRGRTSRRAACGRRAPRAPRAAGLLRCEETTTASAAPMIARASLRRPASTTRSATPQLRRLLLELVPQRPFAENRQRTRRARPRAPGSRARGS